MVGRRVMSGPRTQKLAPGMTVQSDGNGGHVAFCAACWWESAVMSFEKARAVACTAVTHACVVRPRRFK